MQRWGSPCLARSRKTQNLPSHFSFYQAGFPRTNDVHRGLLEIHFVTLAQLLVEMEAQHHSYHQSPAAARLLNHLRSQGINRVPEDRGPTGGTAWRGVAGIRRANLDSSGVSMGSTGGGQVEEVRDDTHVRLLPRVSTMNRGLAEVTNRLEQHYDAGSQGLWVSSGYSPDSCRPKYLPASAYTDRFRSLVRPPAETGDPLLSRQVAYGATSYWREREELLRMEMMRREGNLSRHLIALQHPAISSLPLPSTESTFFATADRDSMRSKYLNTRRTSKESMIADHVDGNHSAYSQRRLTRGIQPSVSTFSSPSKQLTPADEGLPEDLQQKRSYREFTADSRAPNSANKKSKSGDGLLDILCSATLELGPIAANPSTGCSCPRSNCIKLYCDCFKAGRPCSGICSCVNCKNTTEETRVDGERIQAIKNTLARNPRAFTGGKKEAVPQNPGDIVCNCLKSRCLKLYCQCFHKGVTCNEACLCISCLNTTAESKVGGRRNLAIQSCLEKRPDAFTKKPKEVGSGCACKNNKCLKKYW